MKPIITFALSAVLTITFVSCMKPKVSDSDWIQELQQKNPLKDNPDYVSVYFKFDTIVDSYRVNGFFYQYYKDKDTKYYNVRVFMYLRNVVTYMEYELSDYDLQHHKFTSNFMSKNIYDIIEDTAFNGFKNGDSLVFTYHNEHDTMCWKGYNEPEIFPLKSNAEFQFYDVDFDGKDELLISCNTKDFHPHPMFEVYELGRSCLKKRDLVINSLTRFDQKRKNVFTMVPDEKLRLTSYYEYEGNGSGNLKLVWYANDPWKSDSITPIPNITSK